MPDISWKPSHPATLAVMMAQQLGNGTQRPALAMHWSAPDIAPEGALPAQQTHETWIRHHNKLKGRVAPDL